MPENASQRFIDDVIGNRVVIVMTKSGAKVHDVWVTDDVEKELRYQQPDEELEFRYWDGMDEPRTLSNPTTSDQRS